MALQRELKPGGNPARLFFTASPRSPMDGRISISSRAPNGFSPVGGGSWPVPTAPLGFRDLFRQSVSDSFASRLVTNRAYRGQDRRFTGDVAASYAATRWTSRRERCERSRSRWASTV